MTYRKILLPILIILVILACTCALMMSLLVPLGKRVVRKADEIATTLLTEGSAILWEDNRTCLVDADHPNPQVAQLKQYAPAWKDTIPEDFYTYMGFRDWWRFPLVYPYSILSVDTTEQGSLVAVSVGMDFRNPGDGMKDAGISGITHLTFDQNMLLVKAGRNIYHLFDFKTGQKGTFASETELFAAARALQFQGEYRLITIEEYGGRFSCPTD